MRWEVPKYGDTKIKKKFALLPINLKGEVRWLEFVKIEYWRGFSSWIPNKFID